jgi:hypothetical protein
MQLKHTLAFTLTLIDVRNVLIECDGVLKPHMHQKMINERIRVQASKLFARGNPCATCDCKAKCRTKTCPCRRASIACSTKCHAKIGKCMNVDEETF